jgi:hypothetical protein
LPGRDRTRITHCCAPATGGRASRR